MSETSIASARASVMIYDDVNKKWVPSGSSSGLSKVHIFQHNCYNTFRVVGRKLHDHEVVINCIILRSLKYNQATETFHQWRDNKQVYGLNFSSKMDADSFARAMNYAVEILTANNIKPNPALPIAQNSSSSSSSNTPIMNNNNINNVINSNVISTSNNQQQQLMIQQQQSAVSQYDEDMGYRTMTKEDMAALQERRMSQQTQASTVSAVSSTSSLSSPGSVSTSSAISVSPPQQQTQQSSSGHQRTSSAPPAPQPPPMTLCATPLQPSIPPPAPAPPCPPPLPNTLPKTGAMNNESDQSSLAAQLQSARLRRSNRQQSAENSGSSTTSSGSGSSSNYGTLGRNQSGMASMMDEMAKTLARRRAAVEKKEPENSSEEQNNTADRKTWNNANKSSTNGCESPKPNRKPFMTSSEELVSKMNGESVSLPLDFESLKQDILREMKKEMNRMKQEIVESIRQELAKTRNNII